MQPQASIRTYSELSELPAKDGYLAKNMLLIPKSCSNYRLNLVKEMQGAVVKREVAYADGKLEELLGFGKLCPNAGCMALGSPLENLGVTMRSPSGEPLERANMVTWVNSCNQVQMGFMNDRDDVVYIYWIDPLKKSRQQETELKPGYDHIHWRNAFLGHEFEVVDKNKKTILRAKSDYDKVTIIRRSSARKVAPKDWAKIINETHTFELGRAARVLHTFTEKGFATAPVPEEIWASIKAYYHNNMLNNHTELWSPSLPHAYVNHWEVETKIIPMADNLKVQWGNALMPYVSAWSGGTELERTAFYGMRIYSRGAKLYSHVDREHTHALSLIINIDQIGMEEPWPLEIYDHDGNPNMVTIKPGELVYYESARCMHGRPRPLAGETFVNMFVHFRPKDKPEWFRENNLKTDHTHGTFKGENPLQATNWATEHAAFAPDEQALVRRRELAHEMLAHGHEDAHDEVAAAKRRAAKMMKRNFPEDDLQEQEDLVDLAKRELAQQDVSWQLGLPLGSAGETYTLTARRDSAAAAAAAPLVQSAPPPATAVELLLSREGIGALLEASALQLFTLVGLVCFVNAVLAVFCLVLVAAIRCVRKSKHGQRWHIMAQMRGRTENYDKKVDDFNLPS